MVVPPRTVLCIYGERVRLSANMIAPTSECLAAVYYEQHSGCFPDKRTSFDCRHACLCTSFPHMRVVKLLTNLAQDEAQTEARGEI